MVSPAIKCSIIRAVELLLDRGNAVACCEKASSLCGDEDIPFQASSQVNLLYTHCRSFWGNPDWYPAPGIGTKLALSLKELRVNYA